MQSKISVLTLRMMDAIEQEFGSPEQCISGHSELEEEMPEIEGEDVIEFVNCIKREEDDGDHFNSSFTDQQCTRMEAVVKEELAGSYLETEPFVYIKEEVNPEPPVTNGDTEADMFGEDAVPNENLDGNLDDNTKEDGESCTPLNHARDLNGDSERFLQEKNEHRIVEGTLKAVRKRRGRKPRYNRHLSDKPFQCKTCQKCFRKPEHLRCHELFHSDERQFSCDICSKGFFTNGDLKRHKVVHTGEKPYACPTCSKTFTQLCNMQSHLRNRCQPKQFSCDRCTRMFRDQDVLQKHKATHPTGKYYSNGKRRKPICQDLPPFICDMCSQCFQNKRDLTAHIKGHMGEDNVICDVCGKNCARRERLIVHMRSHTGEKPFSCSVCGKAFSQQCNLKKHEILHLPD